MRHTLISVSVSLCLIVPLAVSGAPRPPETLSQKQRERILAQVLPAYRLGNPALLIHALSPMMVRMNDSQLNEANQLLANKDVASIGELLADARLLLIQQTADDRIPLPKGRELLLTLKVLHDRLQASLAEQDQHIIMSDPLPKPDPLHEYKRILWEVHVLDNRLANADRIAQYAARIRRGARFNPKLMDEDYRAVLHADYAAIVDDLALRRQELEEREIELRIARIHAASTILATAGLSAAKPPADRFLAAYVIGLDGAIVDEFFQERAKDKRKPLIRAALNERDLPAQVQRIVQRAEVSNGDLVRKMQLLYVGLHWWSRGRYGAGTNAWGLLKSHKAMRSHAAQFPLFMPISTPTPTDPNEQIAQQVPSVDRRHHYTWATEYRPITQQVVSGTPVTRQDSFEQTGTQTTHLTRFY